MFQSPDNTLIRSKSKSDIDVLQEPAGAYGERAVYFIHTLSLIRVLYRVLRRRWIPYYKR
jgi:hypothetical protein